MTRRLMALGAACLIALGACGGDGGGDAEGGTDALSKKQFLAEANHICEEGNEQIDEAAETLGPGQPSKKEFEKFLKVLVEKIESQLSRLAELEPPDELASDYEQLLANARTALARVKARGFKIFQARQDPFAKVNQAARDIGLTKCSE